MHFDLQMPTTQFYGTTETDLRMRQEATQIAVPSCQWIRHLATTVFMSAPVLFGASRKTLLWFMVEKNINTLAAVLSANPPADHH
jgi:hypothetical protein